MAQHQFPITYLGRVVGTGTVEDDGAVTGKITGEITDKEVQDILRGDLLKHVSIDLDPAPAVPRETLPVQEMLRRGMTAYPQQSIPYDEKPK